MGSGGTMRGGEPLTADAGRPVGLQLIDDALQNLGESVPMEYREDVGRVDVWHHIACWYTIRKGGTTAYQFAKRGEHLLRWRRELATPHEYWWRHGYPPPDVEAISRDFDYFWKIGEGLPTTEELESRGVRLAVRGDAELWSLDR